MMLCVFHQEKTPSLRIWSSGRFKCYGCGESGHVHSHPRLTKTVVQIHPHLAPITEKVRMELLEAKGQLRIPGADNRMELLEAEGQLRIRV